MTIDIKSQLELLKELQEIDIRVRTVEAELESIPEQIEEVKAEWRRAKDALDAKEHEKAASEKAKRELEADLEDSTVHLLEREGKLYAIKTNKEYQAALKEIADGKRANREREENIIKLMEKIEGLSKEITQLSQTVAEKESECAKDEEELLEKRRELEKQKEIEAAELIVVEKKVDKQILDKYRFIASKYMDPLAPIIKGICQGCNMNIPPQMYIELLKGLKFHFCPSCRRFIYASQEKKEEENEGSEE